MGLLEHSASFIYSYSFLQEEVQHVNSCGLSYEVTTPHPL